MRVVNFHDWDTVGESVYIGRKNIFYGLKQSLYANPIRIGQLSREAVLIAYEDYLHFMLDTNKWFADEFDRLPKDAILVCWCKPLACHGDIIVKVWNERNK